MKGHASAETMADFRAGLLPAREAAAIHAHLSTCARCAELDRQLASVTSLLAATPTPAMPATLVARLDAALAAETAARAAAGTGATAPPGATGPPGTAAPPSLTTPPGHRRPGGSRRDGQGPGRGETRRSRLALRLAAAAAGIVLVASGGYAIAQLVSGGTPAATTAGPELSAPHSVTGQSAASRGTARRSTASGLAPAPAAQPGATLPVVHSGTRYLAGLLPAQVRSVLRRFPAPVPTAPAHLPGVAAAPAAFPQLAACVSRVAGTAMPRLIDLASYGGRPVAVIVVPVPGSSVVRVWLVGMACPAQGGDVITHFSMPGTG